MWEDRVENVTEKEEGRGSRERLALHAFLILEQGGDCLIWWKGGKANREGERMWAKKFLQESMKTPFVVWELKPAKKVGLVCWKNLCLPQSIIKSVSSRLIWYCKQLGLLYTLFLHFSAALERCTNTSCKNNPFALIVSQIDSLSPVPKTPA